MLDNLILNLYKVKVIKFGDFTLSSGKRSPYYFDFRILPSFPDTYAEVINLWLQKLKDIGIKFDGVVGIASAGIVHASVLGFMLKKPIGYVRAEKKDHGTGKLVEGSLKDLKVLLVDDVATTGGTLIRAYNQLIEEGVKVVAFSVILDREEGAESAVEKLGIPLISLIKTSQIFVTLRRLNIIDEPTYQSILNYMRESQ
ncbi:MAG: orotate phosphoribosyltransferase [Sulfolobales archaeon]|nr:orotate phosphoribosyltransferase [Sulfolobales archaeon]MCX8186075.1 orotate phosphoribosyltransferase [Sulfolobales archaeon]MDW7969370.1 orotate phosphoribosyltransferase [Sulfolobales archaeon]